eukprot:scaffold32381_cov75-Phaeocystis_antarctica.AAC.2
MRKVIYLVPSSARTLEVIVSGADAAQQAANTPSATQWLGAPVESNTPPPAYDHDGLVVAEHVELEVSDKSLSAF